MAVFADFFRLLLFSISTEQERNGAVTFLKRVFCCLSRPGGQSNK